MSTVDPGRSTGSSESYESGRVAAYPDEDSGYAWVLFAGTMLALLATLNFIEGVAAVSNSKFFVANAQFVISNLNTWGWVMICISAIQLLVAVGVWAQVKSVRWFGVAIAGLNAIALLLMMPAYPFWSLTLFAVDILVIYGLVAHGAREEGS